MKLLGRDAKATEQELKEAHKILEAHVERNRELYVESSGEGGNGGDGKDAIDVHKAKRVSDQNEKVLEGRSPRARQPLKLFNGEF